MNEREEKILWDVANSWGNEVSRYNTHLEMWDALKNKERMCVPLEKDIARIVQAYSHGVAAFGLEGNETRKLTSEQIAAIEDLIEVASYDDIVLGDEFEVVSLQNPMRVITQDKEERRHSILIHEGVGITGTFVGLSLFPYSARVVHQSGMAIHQDMEYIPHIQLEGVSIVTDIDHQDPIQLADNNTFYVPITPEVDLYRIMQPGDYARSEHEVYVIDDESDE